MRVKLEQIKIKVEEYFSLIDQSIEDKYIEKNRNLFFCESNDNYLPGMYVYEDKKGYHIDHVGDRGSVVDKKIYESIEDLYFQLCWEKVTSISIKYASNNREQGKDWRRIMFKKRLELLKLININYYQRGMEIIDGILLENPYNDVLLG